MIRELHVVTGNAGAFPLANVVSEVSIGDVLSAPEFTSLHRVFAAPVIVNTLRQLTNPNLPYNAGTNPYIPVQSVQLTVTNTNLLPDLGGLFNVFPAVAPDPPDRAFVPNYSTTTFGFLRQPRPTLGEPALQLSASTVIDISPNVAVPTTLHDSAYTGTDLDVLFAPNGEVLNASQGKIILWVRNPEFPHPRTSGDARANYEQAGEMSLIVVYTKTGSVSTQPVNIPVGAGPATPHSYANDGINSGL
jgi:hypothetical protein